MCGVVALFSRCDPISAALMRRAAQSLQSTAAPMPRSPSCGTDPFAASDPEDPWNDGGSFSESPSVMSSPIRFTEQATFCRAAVGIKFAFAYTYVPPEFEGSGGRTS